ncbi:MAG: penicillin-binding protein 1A, partial [Halothiobacillaceae bacterium]
TYTRKLNEILLALKIDRELSKEEVLALYLNKIYLGNRAYGIAAAAQIYYGKTLDQLTLAESAMLVGLPKAPSLYNPIINPERALTRRNYILERMRALGYIDAASAATATQEIDHAKYHGATVESRAPYVAEMVRQQMVDKYGEEAYTSGYNVYTTIISSDQEAANLSVQEGLFDYERRHGYRGAVDRLALDKISDAGEWQKRLKSYPTVGPLLPGLVIEIDNSRAKIYRANGETVEITYDNLKWAHRYINENSHGQAIKTPQDVLTIGDVIMMRQLTNQQWQLAQIPAVSGALVALDTHTGAIRALVGGFDFYHSKFNRVTQAKRQPGSSFKPFIYSAALEKGYTAATIINDAPVMFDDSALEAKWRPENYSGTFQGPTRLRDALATSRNLVSIRLLDAIGIDHAIQHIANFGFDPATLPHNLSLSLGTGEVTALDLARAHSVFANGGYLIQPYFIDRISDTHGTVIEQSHPATVCDNCIGTALATAAPRVISAQNAFIMSSMMRDVITRGTAQRAKSLGRHDFSGKTGTTNEQRDAWFVGFNRDLLAVSWVGFDEPHPLGNRETGGSAALPLWMKFMGKVLEGKPEVILDQPPGIVSVKINPVTGERAASNDPNAIFELFPAEVVPPETSDESAGLPAASGGATTAEHLF